MNIFRNLFNSKTDELGDVYKLESKRDAKKLIKLLNSQDSSIVSASIDALGNIKASEAAEPLLELLKKGGNRKLRLTILAALSEIGNPKAADVLLESFDDEDVSFQSCAVRAFLKIKDKRSILKRAEVLIKRPETEIDVQPAFVNQGDEALSQLEKLIEHTDAHIIFRAVQAIQLIGTPKALNLLLKALNSSNEITVETASNQIEFFYYNNPNFPIEPVLEKVNFNFKGNNSFKGRVVYHLLKTLSYSEKGVKGLTVILLDEKTDLNLRLEILVFLTDSENRYKNSLSETLSLLVKDKSIEIREKADYYLKKIIVNRLKFNFNKKIRKLRIFK